MIALFGSEIKTTKEIICDLLTQYVNIEVWNGKKM